MDAFIASSTVLQKAATLLFVVDLAAFQAHHAIYAVSKSELLATNPENSRTVHLLQSHMVRMQQQRITNHLDRCKLIWDLVQYLPKMKETTLGTIQFNLEQNFRKKALPDLILLVGLDDSYTNNQGSKYKMIQRYVTGKTKSNKGGVQILSSIFSSMTIEAPSSWNPSSSSISPMSSSLSSSLSSQPTHPPPTTPTPEPSPPPPPTATATATMMSQQLASKPSAFKTSSALPSFKKLTTMKATRKTTAAKQDERELKIAFDDLRSAAYKIGAKAYSLNKQGRLKLKKFSGGANKVATEVNSWFECELISGRDIEKSYRDRRVGQSPPRRGKPPIISREVFSYICDAVYSANSIDQANCDPNRMDRVKMRELICSIVNTLLIKKTGMNPLMILLFMLELKMNLLEK